MNEAIDSTNGEMTSQRVNNDNNSSSSINPDLFQAALMSGIVGQNQSAFVPPSTVNFLGLPTQLLQQQQQQHQQQQQQQQQQQVLQQIFLQQALSAQAALTATALASAAALPINFDSASTIAANSALNPVALNAAILLGGLNTLMPTIVAGQHQQQQQNLIPAAINNPAIGLPAVNAALLNPQAIAMLGAQFPYLLSAGQQAQPHGGIAAPSVASLPFPFGALVSANNSPMNDGVSNPVAASTAAVASLLSSGASITDQQRMEEILESLANGGAPSTTTAAGMGDPVPGVSVSSTSGSAGKTSETIKSEGKSNPPTASGRPPIIIYMDCDDESLSDYQCVLRKQIELFEATAEDVQWNAQGRNKAVR
jgi:hypothetical protein